MEVKPIGKERDYQIHEIRNPESPPYEAPPYSTSLTDAWPLWEEMKVTGLLCLNVGREETEVILPFRTTGGIYYKGKDEADAISGAWVMWKGEDDEKEEGNK